MHPLSETSLTPTQKEVLKLPLNAKAFVQGQAGSGKTTAAVRRMLALIAEGVPADTILILVPQRSLGQPFREAVKTSGFQAGGEPPVLTINGLSQRMLTLFWPMVAANAGFAHPEKPPTFLTLETAQYYMAGLVEPLLQKGYFDGVTIDPNRLYSQVIDNLNKSAVIGFPPQEIADRLTRAWSGKSNQAIIYTQAEECALLFRQLCLEKNLLDFSLQLSTFREHVWSSLLFRQYLNAAYRHLIYDNVEEDYPVAHDMVEEWLPDLDSALMISDSGAGFRYFIGADSVSARRFGNKCQKVVEFDQSLVKTAPLDELEKALDTSLIQHRLESQVPSSIESSFSIHPFRFYPQVVDWVTETVSHLITKDKVPAEEIAILTPFLSDALRFSFSNRFDQAGLKLTTLRPSRGLRDEPAVKAVLTLVKLLHPEWNCKPTRDEFRNAMLLVIEDCDYIRADLITMILYSASKGTLNSFDRISNSEMQQRLTFTVGERFETLRQWIEDHTSIAELELDTLIGRLFGELLSQPGYKFHNDYDAAAAVNRLVESARKFRQIMKDSPSAGGAPLGLAYVNLVENGTLSAQYLPDWSTDNRLGSVLLAPAYSFLMNNHPVSHQFWLDVGSQGWCTRLDQPLTHPHVLNRNWDPALVWNDMHERRTNQEILARISNGLIRRCGEHIYMCTINVNEQGNEERGALMMALQTVLRSLRSGESGSHV